MKKIARFIAWKCVIIYFKARSWWPIWFYILNREAHVLFAAHPPTLNALQERIVRELNENGIAMTHLDELFPGENILSLLQARVHALVEEKTASGSIEKRKLDKPFLTYLFDAPVVDSSNPFVKLALDPVVRNVINSYFHMYTRFFYMTLNITHPVARESQAISSQRWHRDPEDKKMCKLFVYLSDVDEQSGPFTYILKSRYGLKWGTLFPQRPPVGSYPDQRQVNEIVPRSEIKICTGRAGTVLFCDTSGLHRGGYAFSHPRIMFTAGFRSSASVTRGQIMLSEDMKDRMRQGTLEASVEYALQPNHVSSRTRYLFGLFRRWNEMYNGKFYE